MKPALLALLLAAQQTGTAPVPVAVPQARAVAARAASSYAGIRLDGPDDFQKATADALRLLEKSGDLPEVAAYVKKIKRARCSGMEVYTGTFAVGDPTWKASAVWYAGAIAHDSRHARLYRESAASSGAEAERKCLAFQLEVLERLGADAKTLAYVRELMKDPTYQNIGAQGMRAEDVCDQRQW